MSPKLTCRTFLIGRWVLKSTAPWIKTTWQQYTGAESRFMPFLGVKQPNLSLNQWDIVGVKLKEMRRKVDRQQRQSLFIICRIFGAARYNRMQITRAVARPNPNGRWWSINVFVCRCRRTNEAEFPLCPCVLANIYHLVTKSFTSCHMLSVIRSPAGQVVYRWG